MEFAFELIGKGRRPYFFARNLIHQMGPLGRADLFTILRGLLEDETFLFATFDASPMERIPSNPETWTLDLKTLRREAWRWKFGVTVLADRRRTTPYGRRANVTALIWN